MPCSRLLSDHILKDYLIDVGIGKQTNETMKDWQTHLQRHEVKVLKVATV